MITLPGTKPFLFELLEKIAPDLTDNQQNVIVGLLDHTFNHPWVDIDLRASMVGNICREYGIEVPKEYEED